MNTNSLLEDCIVTLNTNSVTIRRTVENLVAEINMLSPFTELSIAIALNEYMEACDKFIRFVDQKIK